MFELKNKSNLVVAAEEILKFVDSGNCFVFFFTVLFCANIKFRI
jgi:hypothetical protein